MKTPNEIVGERITAALEEAAILLPDSTKGLAEKLSKGQLGSSQWTTLFGLDQNARKQNAKDEIKIN